MRLDEWCQSVSEIVDLRDDWVHLSDVLGSCRVPATVAEVIARAVEVLERRGDVSPRARWQALEWMAAEILGGAEQKGP